MVRISGVDFLPRPLSLSLSLSLSCFCFFLTLSRQTNKKDACFACILVLFSFHGNLLSCVTKSQIHTRLLQSSLSLSHSFFSILSSPSPHFSLCDRFQSHRPSTQKPLRLESPCDGLVSHSKKSKRKKKREETE